MEYTGTVLFRTKDFTLAVRMNIVRGTYGPFQKYKDLSLYDVVL
jgi:hypothetical protein